MYWINKPEYFTPSASWALDENLAMGSRGFITSKQNPTQTELRNGIYKPRLTLTTRFNHTHRREATLKVELSLPKLIFGNNFDELTDADFVVVTDKLHQRLDEMGVKVWTHSLVDAPVSAIHYSKNIPLTDGTTPHYLISKIKEANIPLSLDVNQTDYRNDGHVYKWHANSYEVAFYDKIHDLGKARISEKRTVETDNAIQLNIFDTVQKRTPFEVMRMEVRLNRRQKINQLFGKIGIAQTITYQSVFSSTTSQLVLLHYLDELERHRPAILDYKAQDAKALLSDLVIHNPEMGPKQILQVLGVKQALDVVDMRELRTIFSKCHPRTWSRLVASAKSIKLPVSQSPFMPIRTHLAQFKPLKLADYQDKLLN